LFDPDDSHATADDLKRRLRAKANASVAPNPLCPLRGIGANRDVNTSRVDCRKTPHIEGISVRQRAVLAVGESRAATGIEVVSFGQPVHRWVSDDYAPVEHGVVKDMSRDELEGIVAANHATELTHSVDQHGAHRRRVEETYG
jgi:hypothetical protein